MLLLFAIMQINEIDYSERPFLTHYQERVAGDWEQQRDPLEIGRLLSYIDTKTQLGEHLKTDNMFQGLSPRAVTMRQEATEELATYEGLPEIREKLAHIAERESQLGIFLNKDAFRMERTPRDAYKAAREAMQSMVEISKLAPSAPETELLHTVFQGLRSFADTPEASFTKGKVYLTPLGIRPHDSAWRWALPLRLSYRGSPMNGRVLATMGLTFYAARQYALSKNGIPDPVTGEAQTAAGLDAVSMAAIMTVTGGMFIPPMNMSVDYTHRPMFISPVHRKFRNSAETRQAIAAYTELDVLQALAGVRDTIRQNGSPWTYPTLDTASTSHYFDATDHRPALLVMNPHATKQAIENDHNFSGLTFLTGPNSGGKSTTVKSVLHSQLLAEMGSAVPAERAAMAPVDYIDYMVPGAPDQDEDIGRFGHELTELSGIFERFSHRSFIGLDDCMDGTTHAERLVVLGNAMRALHSIGGTAIFSTHATELVQEFNDAALGTQIQVEFDGERPTHKIIPGVSHTSHADRVAKIVGMDKDGINASLARRGYKTI